MLQLRRGARASCARAAFRAQQRSLSGSMEIERNPGMELDMAWATASESAKFTYKGTPNDDPSFTVSTVWKKVNGAWKLAHAHRSTATGNDMSSWDGCV